MLYNAVGFYGFLSRLIKAKKSMAVCGTTSPPRKITYHMGSHSVTGSNYFPAFTLPKMVLDLATPKGRGVRLRLPKWWLHLKIVYPPEMVRYLRKKPAVS